MKGESRFENREGKGAEHAPEEIIAAMLYYLNKEKSKEKIPAEPQMIHGGMHKLKKDHGSFLRRFVFSTASRYPYSDLVEKVFFRLQQAGIIGVINPAYDEYVINSEGVKGIEKVFLPLFSEEERKELEEMASKFGKYLEKS